MFRRFPAHAPPNPVPIPRVRIRSDDEGILQLAVQQRPRPRLLPRRVEKGGRLPQLGMGFRRWLRRQQFDRDDRRDIRRRLVLLDVLARMLSGGVNFGQLHMTLLGVGLINAT